MCYFVQTLRIGITGRIDDIYDVLDKGFGKDVNYEFELLLKPNTDVDTHLESTTDNQDTEIVFYSKNQQSLGYKAIKTLCSELAQYIISNYEENLIKKIISDNYGYYSFAEQEQLLESSLLKLRLGEKYVYTVNSRKILIEKKLSEYFKTYDYIQIDGFVRFRLKEYMLRLEEYIEEAADEFVAKREYNEFIKLLRSFVEIQNPQHNKIHIATDKSGFYSIYDGNKNDLTLECTKSFLSELEEGANFDDVLMSYLIMVAPRTIVLHGYQFFRNMDLLETITNVFPGRFIICTDCEFCDNIL